jgi:serine protease Do
MGQQKQAESNRARPRKFDGQDIKELLDLPRIVTGTTVGKQVEIVLIRGGKEETHTVRVGRLDETPTPTQSINR